MKSIVFTFLLIAFSSSIVLSQDKKTNTAKPRFFNRTELSYTFGLNETLNNEKTNALHVKTVLGFALPKVGLGFGLANSTFRSAQGSSGANFNTISFSANGHVLAKDIQDDGLNFFLKGAIGYAPKIFAGYNKGLTYEGGAGFLITNKKGSKYFLNGIYHHQNIDDFFLSTTGRIQVKSFGVGVGTWF